MDKLIKIIIIIIIFGAGYIFFSYQKPNKEENLNREKVEENITSEIPIDKSLAEESLNKEKVEKEKVEENIITEKPIDDTLASDNDNISQKTIPEFAKYKIEFAAVWSENTHPGNYPSGAHFSPFVAYSHNNSKESKIFSKGELSTPGIELMAETGKTTILNEEIDDMISKELAFKKTQGSVFNSPGITSADLEFSKNYSHFIFMSMLAPSPDWFVAQTASLIKDGDWIEKLELELITYDAGTDNGEVLTAIDSDTNPKEIITLFFDNLQNLGKITLTLIK